jgi:hypothetical protein
MANEIVNMSDHFKGLPMGDVIGGPLNAACDAQVRLAKATSGFIRVISFLPPPPDSTDPNAVGDTRQVQFKFKRPVDAPGCRSHQRERRAGHLRGGRRTQRAAAGRRQGAQPEHHTVDITFDMEVKSSFSGKESTDASASLAAEASFGFGMFKGTVKIQGSVATHKENARSSDNSAKYTVKVHAEDAGMPEGLARVMDILQSAAAPRKISAPTAVA